MAWNTGITYNASTNLNAALINGIGNDLRTWGGNVDAGSNGIANLASITGASGILTITATKVGIGVASPGFTLSLGAAVVAQKLAIYDSGVDFFGFGVASGTLRYDSGIGSDHAFFTSAGTERVRFTNSGGVKIASLPSSSPGAGTKQLWYDPADSNRVKYAP